uniref:Uncharacterized protein n=1 Tax=Aureoumbra lagunensis TaxID=44058 RepID=A0A7S3NIP6_9STRA
MSQFSAPFSEDGGGATTMFRMLAREEQKKLAKLKAEGSNISEIKATEKRLEHLLQRIQAMPSNKKNAEKAPRPTYDSEKRETVKIGDDQSFGSVCDCCGKATERKVQTGRTISKFCSSDCQRKGWGRHLERVRRDDKSQEKWAEIEKVAQEQDEQWRKETTARLACEKELDVDFLGVVRGKCDDTGCSGYVQARGVPRNIKPTYNSEGKIEQVGVWSWNRTDHMACRRCGAPSTEHEDLTQKLVDENKRLKAIAKNTPRKPKSLSTSKLTSSPTATADFFYASRNSPQTTGQSQPQNDDDSTIDITNIDAQQQQFSRDYLSGLPIKELKLLCVRFSVDITGLVDKADIVQALFFATTLPSSKSK